MYLFTSLIRFYTRWLKHIGKHVLMYAHTVMLTLVHTCINSINTNRQIVSYRLMCSTTCYMSLFLNFPNILNVTRCSILNLFYFSFRNNFFHNLVEFFYSLLLSLVGWLVGRSFGFLELYLLLVISTNIFRVKIDKKTIYWYNGKRLWHLNEECWLIVSGNKWWKLVVLVVAMVVVLVCGKLATTSENRLKSFWMALHFNFRCSILGWQSGFVFFGWLFFVGRWKREWKEQDE